MRNDDKKRDDTVMSDSNENKANPAHEAADFHVVGVGASAGGLDAIERFFESMPCDTGAAYVVVQHLSPDFKSHMEELLGRKTSLAIKRVTNNLRVQPNTIYLIPPNTEMVIANGQLLLTERDRDESLNLPIDHFLRSLANDCGRKSIGVILSGTGSDGSRGIVDINEAGGLILCQDENSAKFDGMPLSAQNTHMVHLVLPPEDMAHAISTYITNLLTPEGLAEQESMLTADVGIDEIFKLLRRDFSIDFSLYKPTTVNRRIDRRISLQKVNNIEEYAEVLATDPQELNTLYKDLLIGVTQFFRDPSAFDVIKKDVIPKILDKKRVNRDPIRVWIAACSTGEEAYSIAILFHEAFESEKYPPDIKIFATDVHRNSLQTASLGIYSEQSIETIPGGLSEKYFTKVLDGYEIIPAIRKMIVFAPHDVANDAPFTKLDLVTCRNMLIYLQPVIQKKVISLFHFALRTGAFLALGPSETPGDLREEFEVEDKKWRIYSKKRDVRLTTGVKLPLGGTSAARPFSKSSMATRRTPESQMLATYDMLLDKCMAPSFLVDERGELVHSFGGAERFLHFRGGRISTNIIEIILEDLKTSVSGALQHAAKEQKLVRYTGISVKTVKGIEHVRVTVDPIRDSRTEMITTLITIEPIEDNAAVVQNDYETDVDVSQLSRDHISTLENELRYTKENLQATVEELETSNEELQATNEELVASNEEMQSTNEELQSVNEELYTVNHEYQRKIAELIQLTDDMNNLFVSTEIGVIFLDNDLNIRRFTPKTAQAFSLLPQDIGRPIRNFTHNILDQNVFDVLTVVMQDEKPFEGEVRDRRDNNWLLRIVPYRTQSKVEGVVLTLVDINSVKATDLKLRRYYEIVESTVEAIVGIDTEGVINSWNHGAEHLYGYLKEEALGQPVSMLIPAEKRDEVTIAQQAGNSGAPNNRIKTIRLRKGGERLNVILAISPVFDETGKVIGYSSMSHDYTQQQIAEQEQEKLAAIIETTTDFVAICDAQGSTLSINPAGRKMLGMTLDEDLEGQSIDKWHNEEQATLINDVAIPAAIKSGEWRGVTTVSDGRGTETPLASVIIAHKNSDGNIAYFSKVGRDITQQLAFEGELKAREVFLRRTLDGLYAFAGVCLPDGTLIEANRTALAAGNLKATDVIGKSFPDTYWWSYSKGVQKQLWEGINAAAAGESVRYDARIRLSEDKFMTIDFQLTPLKNDAGEVTHLIPSGIDISERVALEAKSRVFKRAFEASITAILISDPTLPGNPIVYVNPGFEKLTGYSSEESVGNNCRFLQGPETDPKAVAALQTAIDRGEAAHVKLLNYRKDGKTFWNELVITPVRDDEQKLTHFVGVQFDMTAHQDAEMELSRARDAAQAANEAKSSFVANMSHEIRTPLTTVVGMAEMLLEQEPDNDKRDTLKMIHQSGEHLVTLVNDVLDMSKIEAGKLESDPVDIAPVGIIEDIAASMRYRANEKGLNFNLKFSGMFPETISTDPVRFRQILFNLTGNAIKFTEVGSVTMSCKIIKRDTNPQLRIEVKDTGIGIKTAEVPSLFKRFTQVDDSTTRRKGGSGLGLYISRRIAEMLGGRLTAKSKRGKGSTFTLTIPTGDLVGKTMIDPSSQKLKSLKSASSDKQSATKVAGHVLVVEDTRGIQILLRRILETAGATVEVAEDGQAALDLFTSRQPSSSGKAPTQATDSAFDLVLLDMHMPRLSGYDTATGIRKLGIKTPIIALTASAMRGDRGKCLRAGCDDYLTKPIDRQTLIAMVAKLIGDPA